MAIDEQNGCDKLIRIGFEGLKLEDLPGMSGVAPLRNPYQSGRVAPRKSGKFVEHDEAGRVQGPVLALACEVIDRIFRYLWWIQVAVLQVPVETVKTFRTLRSTKVYRDLEGRPIRDLRDSARLHAPERSGLRAGL